MPHLARVDLIAHKIEEGRYEPLHVHVDNVATAKRLYGILFAAGYEIGIMAEYVETKLIGQTTDVIDWETI